MKTKKHKHKFILGSMEVRGKTFAETKLYYFCEEGKCNEEKVETLTK